jgi:cyclopropane fatty-acyl-phospholipid synthase-like methyltransferase
MPAMSKPFSPACARNRDAILDALRCPLAERTRLLEIGSGTGQHAVHVAAALPQLTWQCSDVAENLPGIRQWLAEAALPNTPPPLEFDINGEPPSGRFDAVFSANTLHIMGWPEVQRLFAVLPQLMSDRALLIVYGPFKVDGAFTGAGNAAFDATLRAADPRRGIRDLEAVDALARHSGLLLRENREMPANNRCVTWCAAPGPV